MSGGGKGGKEEEKTEIPQWLRDPAIRNLARAEAVQQLPYMPYYGPSVAAFTPAQNAAFDANIGAAEAFGLLAPNTLTATSGMPTPEEFAGGFTGYSSQGLYDQALNELKAKQPGAVAQYNALFGNAVPAPVYPSSGGGGGSRFRGSASPSSPSPKPVKMNPIAGIPQAEYEKAMADTYAKVRVGQGANDYGYHGTGSQGRAGSRAPSYVNTTKVEVAPPYKQASSAKLLGGTPKNYFAGKRVTGGR